ncbi:MAG: hypothetical protein U9Q82_13525 [Chloroflexota bacterium]|nr:hypothetical protein [Chloroflexota bacterium]
MSTTTHTTTIPKVALRALTELTGEPRLDVALLITLQDAIEHRLNKINATIHDYEQKYSMSYKQFQARGQDKTIPDQFSYDVEKDYLEWDGLISRKKKLEQISQWLI